MTQELMNLVDINSSHFLNDWPEPPKCNSNEEEDLDLNEIKLWRLQMLLAQMPWGIPSLAFAEEYLSLFGKEFNVREFGFEHFSEMICKMPDVFTVQEPDEVTALLFPKYVSDRILHDARLGRDFSQPDLGSDLAASRSICTSTSSLATSIETAARHQQPNDDENPEVKFAHDQLINQVKIERDQEFPPDVVLPGEPYHDIPILSSTKLKNTRGIYQAKIMSVASPSSLYIQLKTTEGETAWFQQLPSLIQKYFDESKYPVDAYSVPSEFLCPGFPCLSYNVKHGEGNWERCVISARVNEPERKLVLVEAIDYGSCYATDPLYLYLIPRKFLEVPRRTFGVALAGIRPSQEAPTIDKWSVKAGSRVRCFSLDNYWIDCVLMDHDSKDNDRVAKGEKSATKQPACVDTKPMTAKSADNVIQRIRGIPRFDVIMVDRNDEYIDIFLDEIMVMETYAKFDDTRKEELDLVKENLKELLKTIPRPINPFLNESTADN